MIVAALLAGDAGAQVIRPDLWTATGVVRAAALTGSTLYIGGDFSYVGPRTGGGLPLDVTTGASSGFPKIEGTVSTAISDGAGGWFIGGVFSSVGGVARANLAHVTSTNLVDPAFAPNASALVRALALDGNTLYVGGGFVVIGGVTRLGAAALNATNGSVLPWNPAPNNAIYTMVVDGPRLYVGGQFTTIAGQPRSQIASFDLPGGTLQAWNPNANGAIRAVVPMGPTVYVGGAFGMIHGVARNWLAAVDSVDGSTLPWNPNPVIGVGSGVSALVARGASLHIAGSFTTISSAPRRYAAAVDTAGQLLAWDPSPNQLINALAVNGSSVFAGGTFDSIGGQARSRMGAVDATSGQASITWLGHANGQVDFLAAAGSSVFVGGAFTSLGGVPRMRLAALDLVTGTATAWNPGANNAVRALATSASTLYVGGDFTQTGGQTRGRLAAYSLATGALLPWNPNVTPGGIYALSVQGSTIYAGGTFLQVGAQLRNCLVSIDANGTINPWNPFATGGLVNAVIANGSTIYVAGNFTFVGGAARNFIAAVDSSLGSALPFNPSANNGINALALRDSTLYAGGFFTNIGGLARNRLAVMHAVSGVVDSVWNPNVTSASVSAITVDDAAVYAGGGFTGIGGQLRNYLAALDPTTGLALSWNPDANSSTLVLSTGADVIYAGGQFTTLGTKAGSVAAIDAPCAPPLEIADSTATLAGPEATVVGDFDADGAPDLAAAVAGGCQVMRNQGGGHFASLSSVNLGGPGRGIAAADFNYDFVLDLAVSTSGGLSVMLGQKANGVPTGSFGSPTTYSVGVDPAGIAVGDFNEDGINDLAVAATGSNSVQILLGNGASGIGSGVFGAPAGFAVGNGPHAVAVGDFNRDGIWDLAASGSAGNAVSILLGQGTSGAGNGSFAAAVNYVVANGPWPMVTGDFNEDGVTDLAVGTSSAVAILLGNSVGNGTFAPAVLNPVSGPVRDLFAADFDGNGRVDLGVTLGAGGTFQYLYGSGSSTVGNGQFMLGTSLPIGGNLSSLEYGAFDSGSPGGSVVVTRLDRNDLVVVTSPCAAPTPPLLEMTSPNGGEVCQLGENVPIQWARNEMIPAVHIEVSRDNGARWKRIASNLTGTEFQWTAAPPGSAAGRVRIVDAQRQGVADASNGSFQMQPLVGVDPGTLRRPSFSSAYPNPSRGSVRFDLRMPVAGAISVEVFDIAGRRVQTLAKGLRAAGEHVLIWDGRTQGGRARNGIYFVRARLPGFEAVRRVVRIE